MLQNLGVLRSKLVPYFSITHAVHGQLPGPFSKLPLTSLRRLALDLVATITCSDYNGNDGLHAAVSLAVAATGEQHYWEQLRECYSIIV